jgi:hypothetical protein
VRGFFIKNQNFKLHDKMATVIAQIACYNNSLPSGSPCSPIISDLLAHMLDIRLIQLMEKRKCFYSRYVDDLTISTNQKVFPSTLAYQLEQPNSAWILGGNLLDAICRAGFSVNHNKTRMQYRDSRLVATGLTVNKKANIHADHYRSARAVRRELFASGRRLARMSRKRRL